MSILSKESCEKIIRNIALNIATNLSIQSEKINENQKKSLSLRWKKSDFDDSKYIASLKSNVLFYKVSIRNKEGLLLKWIESGNIPNDDRIKEEIEVLTKKCRDYVERGIKSEGKTFNNVDRNTFSSYDKLDNDQIKIKLEQDYKTLNLYNEVFSIFINDLGSNGLDEFSNIDSKEIIKLIKADVVKATNYIKKNIDKLEVTQYSNNETLNHIETRFIKVLNEIDDEVLADKMERAYEEACTIEEIEYDEGFGFDIDGIKNFICSTVLLDLVRDKEALFLNGGLRLLIGGEFGATNYSDFIQHIIINKIGISKKVYDNGIKIIENRHQRCIENTLSKRKTKSSNYIDIDEYIYILENTDSNKKYNKKSSHIENQQKVCNSQQNVEENEHVSYEDDEYEVSDTPKKRKKIAIIGLSICVILSVGIGYLYGSGAFEKEKPEVEASVNQVESYEEEVETESEVSDAQIDDYIIADSSYRYLTVEELEQYSDEELGYIRNEIFARYGYIFKSDKYIEYFYEKSWYTPNVNFEGNEEDFNQYELANIKLIKSVESKRKGKTSSNEYRDYFYIQEGNPDEYYAVYTEAYTYKSDAESYKKVLNDKNINAIIKEEDSLYKVQVGDTTDSQVAKDICEELEDINIDTYILGYSTEYDLELDEIRYLAENGYYEQFASRYSYFKKELESRPLFGRYTKLLEELYEEYESYI